MVNIKRETVERALELAKWYHKHHHMTRDVKLIPELEALFTSSQSTEIEIDLRMLKYLQDRATKTHELQKSAVARELISALEAAAADYSDDTKPSSLLP